jgi:hypothetical protein
MLRTAPPLHVSAMKVGTITFRKFVQRMSLFVALTITVVIFV